MECLVLYYFDMAILTVVLSLMVLHFLYSPETIRMFPYELFVDSVTYWKH